MNPAYVQELLNARPFKPFVVYLPIAEDSIFIDDPKLARVDGESEILFVRQHPAQSKDHWDSMIDLRLVSLVKVKRGKNES